MEKVIDVQGVWTATQERETPEKLLAAFQEEHTRQLQRGYDFRWLLVPGFYDSDESRQALEAARDHQELFIGAFPQIGLLGYTPEDRRRLESLIDNFETAVAGLKVSPILGVSLDDTSTLRPYLDLAKAHDIPAVLVHCERTPTTNSRTHPTKIREYLRHTKNPEQLTIFAHMGGLHPSLISEMYEIIAEHPARAMVTTTGISLQSRTLGIEGSRLNEQVQLEAAKVIRAHPTACLFGTDFPYLNMHEVSDVHTLVHGERTRQRLLYENANTIWPDNRK